MRHKGWFGVDLDGTLAMYDHWQGAEHIGEPVPLMVDRVKRWLAAGREVRIFTARIYPYALISQSNFGMMELTYAHGSDITRNESAILAAKAIQKWCFTHLGEVLPITSQKDYSMIELWDDRCVQVEPNTGRRVGAK